MPVEYKKTVAVLKGICSVEEAEILLEWLQNHPKAKINLRNIDHMHTAVLQVLMVAARPITVLPENKTIQRWLLPVLNIKAEKG